MALTTSLISFWEMDEASGNRNDSTASANNLLESAAISRTTGVNGVWSAALAGTSLSKSTNASLETGNISWTFAGWTALNAWTDYYSVVSKYPATDNQKEYLLYYWFDIHKLEFYARKGDDSGFAIVQSTVVIPASNSGWHFYVFGQNISTSQIFISIDDETLVTTSNPTGMHVGNGAFIIGDQFGFATSLFQGWTDQVGFWKRVLTPTERTWLYNSGTGRSYAQILAESAAETRTIAMVSVG